MAYIVFAADLTDAELLAAYDAAGDIDPVLVEEVERIAELVDDPKVGRLVQCVVIRAWSAGHRAGYEHGYDVGAAEGERKGRDELLAEQEARR